MKESTKEWLAEKIPGGGFISDITGAIETNLAKASRFILFVDLGYAGYRAVTHSAGTKDNTLDAIWLVSQILAFDLSSPGLERIAREAEARGDKGTARKTRITKWAGIVLGVLTFVEMGLIQLGWLPEYQPAFSFVLMVLRGAASVLVLNFTGIDQHTPDIPAQPQQQQNQLDELATAFNQQIAQLTIDLSRIREEIGQDTRVDLAQLKTDMSTQIQVAINEAMSTLKTDITKQASMSTPSGHSDIEGGHPESDEVDTRQDKTDKLEVTLQFLREHPERATAPDIDEQLAEILGLKRASSARFWRLKAMEMLKTELPASGHPESDEVDIEVDIDMTLQRILEYRSGHPKSTHKEIAEALSISEKTVQRKMKALMSTGHPESDEVDTGQQRLRVVK